MSTPPDIDRECADRLRAGDDSALTDIMERYKAPILSFVFRMLNDAQEAQDVAQDVFVRVYYRIATYNHELRFSTWLFQIARNVALDRLRKLKRHPVVLLEELPETPVGGAQDQSSMNEIGEMIAAAVAELPEDQRVAIVLAEYEGRSYAEIAEIMKTSEKCVESRLYRVKQFLRKRLSHLLPLLLLAVTAYSSGTGQV